MTIRPNSSIQNINDNFSFSRTVVAMCSTRRPCWRLVMPVWHSLSVYILLPLISQNEVNIGQKFPVINIQRFCEYHSNESTLILTRVTALWGHCSMDPHKDIVPGSHQVDWLPVCDGPHQKGLIPLLGA